MSKLTPIPQDTAGEDSQSSGDERTYPVGYGRPPMHTRFKPGQSGNRKGRPKRQRNVRTVLEEVLNQRITIREGNRTRSVSKLDGIILTMANRAVQGDTKSQNALIGLLRCLGLTGEPAEAINQGSFTADDAAVIADYLRRRGLELQQTKNP
jgi:hypothetical protein